MGALTHVYATQFTQAISSPLVFFCCLSCVIFFILIIFFIFLWFKLQISYFYRLYFPLIILILLVSSSRNPLFLPLFLYFSTFSSSSSSFFLFFLYYCLYSLLICVFIFTNLFTRGVFFCVCVCTYLFLPKCSYLIILP